MQCQFVLASLSTLAPNPVLEIGARLGLWALHPQDSSAIWDDAGHIIVLASVPLGVQCLVYVLAKGIIFIMVDMSLGKRTFVDFYSWLYDSSVFGFKLYFCFL